MFGNKPPPKAVIRKVTVAKPIPPPKPAQSPESNGSHSKSNGNSSSRNTNGSSSRKPNGASSWSTGNGFLKPNGRYHKSSSRTDSSSPASSRRGKRKQPSPGGDMFSSDSSDASGDEDGSRKRKRSRASGSPRNGTLEPDYGRVIFGEDAVGVVGSGGGEEGGPVGGEEDSIIQGWDLTHGKAKEYKRVFGTLDSEEIMGDEIEEVELQYPSSSSREKFQLVTPLDREGYNPLEDIIQSIHHILTNYFPPTLSSQLTDDAAGLPRRLKRAVQTQSFTNFKSVITEFNDLITTSLSDGTIPTHLKTVHTLPLSLIERILSQVYSRTVSPEVHILKQYENGTDNVYGELLPRFTNQIFIETHLTSSQIFVDLGSGVGNVVLQAALQTGCQSWGIEFMPNPARLAQRQKSEFEARCRRWGIQPGSTHLLEGDFLTSSPITDILKKADVVLVNNQAFTPELNDNLVMKFLDLKDGCKVVSLKSFVPAKWVMKEFNLNDVRNLLHPAEVKEYFSDSVSWTDVGGTWFVAVKDSGKVGRFSEGIGRRGR